MSPYSNFIHSFCVQWSINQIFNSTSRHNVKLKLGTPSGYSVEINLNQICGCLKQMRVNECKGVNPISG